jgi:putative transposase
MVVERTLAWLGRNRRLCRDMERLAETAIAFVVLAAVFLLLRRIGRPA